jgi:tRNA/rRNA methyltransferase
VKAEDAPAPAPNALDQVRVVLVNPRYAGNAGSVCRAMKNMGLRHLSLVAPPSLWDERDALQMAVNAADVWADRRTFATLEPALADCVAVAATTARIGLYREHARSPRDWAGPLLDLARQGPVALLFGSEDRGLLNEDIQRATHFIHIPTSPEYPSLNLAQAVLVVAYELFTASDRVATLRERSELAPHDLRERMLEKWEHMLLEIGFMDERKADHMMHGLRRVLSRGNLTVNDVRILMGVAQQAEWAAHHGPVRRGKPVRAASPDSDPTPPA